MITPRFTHTAWPIAVWILTACCLQGSPGTGRQFIAIDNFDNFSLEPTDASVCRLTSPPLEAGFGFDQIIVTWNIAMAAGTELMVEVQPEFTNRTGRFYTLGYWAGKDASETSRRLQRKQNLRFSFQGT